MSLLAPSADDWSLMRPNITEAYKAKQQTARSIVESLRLQGWLVTEKMLRDRLKQWGLKKNRSKQAAEKVSELALVDFLALEDDLDIV